MDAVDYDKHPVPGPSHPAWPNDRGFSALYPSQGRIKAISHTHIHIHTYTVCITHPHSDTHSNTLYIFYMILILNNNEMYEL